MFSSHSNPHEFDSPRHFQDEQFPTADHLLEEEGIGAAVEPTHLPHGGFGKKAFPGINPADVMPLDQLLASLDVPREERPRRDLRPQWLRDIIDCVADLFEPLAHAGRVGFECEPGERQWRLSFYLGAAEHVGGALDGHVEAINFRFNVASLLKYFEHIDRCEWNVFPTPEAIGIDDVSRDDIPRGLSSIVVEGVAMTETGLGEPLRIEIHSIPPAETDVALKVYGAGDVKPVDSP